MIVSTAPAHSQYNSTVTMILSTGASKWTCIQQGDERNCKCGYSKMHALKPRCSLLDLCRFSCWAIEQKILWCGGEWLSLFPLSCKHYCPVNNTGYLRYFHLHIHLSTIRQIFTISTVVPTKIHTKFHNQHSGACTPVHHKHRVS
jgi:hypothetical protein